MTWIDAGRSGMGWPVSAAQSHGDREYDAIPFAGDMDFFRLGAGTPNPLGGARGHPGHPIKTPVSHTHLSTTPKTIYRV
jgi:hypothetical protein